MCGCRAPRCTTHHSNRTTLRKTVPVLCRTVLLQVLLCHCYYMIYMFQVQTGSILLTVNGATVDALSRQAWQCLQL